MLTRVTNERVVTSVCCEPSFNRSRCHTVVNNSWLLPLLRQVQLERDDAMSVRQSASLLDAERHECIIRRSIMHNAYGKEPKCYACHLSCVSSCVVKTAAQAVFKITEVEVRTWTLFPANTRRRRFWKSYPLHFIHFVSLLLYNGRLLLGLWRPQVACTYV